MIVRGNFPVLHLRLVFNTWYRASGQVARGPLTADRGNTSNAETLAMPTLPHVAYVDWQEHSG